MNCANAMDLPNLRHFRNGGVFSDPVDALVGEAWVQAVYSDKGWVTADGIKLKDILEWRSGQKAEQESKESRQGAARVQGRNIAQRQTGTGKRSSRKIPPASDRDRAE